MKMIVAIIHDRDQRRVADALRGAGFRFTRIGSTGGFLREGNATLLIGVTEDQVDHALRVLSECSKHREQYLNVLPPEAAPVGTFMANPVKVTVGGAVCFVLDVARFERY